jgi:DNA invertase Pin-like site-specific DNA recombinase
MRLGYVRISTAEQNTASQIKLIQDQGIETDNIYVDVESGAVRPEDRPAYQKLLARIKAGGIDEVVIREYSRIGRDLIESYYAVLVLMRNGVKIISLSKNETMINNQTPAIQLIMITLALESATKMREELKKNTKMGMDNARLKGTRSGKPIGRPVVTIDFDEVRKVMREKNLKEKQAVRVLGIKEGTYYKRKRDMGIKV